MRHPSPVVLAVAAACFLTGCTGGGAQSSGGGNGGDKTTLRYLIEELEDADALAKFKDHLGDFKVKEPAGA